MILDIVQDITRQAGEFESAAHAILSRHEASSRSRVISLRRTRRQLQGLSLHQDELLREALDCIEHGLYRAGHVSAWQAFIDLLSEKLAADGLLKVSRARPKMPKLSSAEELREWATEHEIIRVARDVRLLTKAEVRILHGMLSKRNECAHPGSYRPDLNESLGYVSELLNRMSHLQPKTV